MGVERLEELALVGPLAKTISLCIEGHPSLLYFLPQFKKQVETLLERLTTTLGGRNPLTVAVPGLDDNTSAEDVVHTGHRVYTYQAVQ